MRSFFICFLAFAILAVTKAQMGGQPVHTLPTDDDAQSAAAVAANSMCEAGSRCYVVSVLDVQRQIVAGTNFYLVFIYSQFSANSMRSLLTARAKVYKDLMGEQQVLESEKAMSSEAPTSVHGQLQTAVEQHFAGSSNADISFSSTIDSVLAETIENDDYSTTPSHKNTFTVYVFDGYLMCAAACSEVPPAVTSRKNTFVVYTSTDTADYTYAATLPTPVNAVAEYLAGLGAAIFGLVFLLIFFVAMACVMKVARRQ